MLFIGQYEGIQPVKTCCNYSKRFSLGLTWTLTEQKQKVAEMLSSTPELGLKAIQDHFLEVLILVVLVLIGGLVSRLFFCKYKM